MPGLEALAEQRHLEVVAHAAVDGDERDRAALDGDDAVERRGGGRDHAAAGLDDQLRLGRQVLARGADQRVEVVADRRRLVGVGVARAEPAAEVVDRELAERGDRRDRLRERLDVEDLRADVDVQALHAQPRAALDPPDQLGRGGRRQPELRPLVAGQHVRVRVGRDARDDPHEHVLRAPGGHRRLEPVDVVARCRPRRGRSRARRAIAISSSLLALPCRTSSAGSAPASSAVTISPPPATSSPSPSSTITRWTAVHGNAFEANTTRERGQRAASPSAYSRARARSAVLGHDQHRRAELRRERVGAAAADA